jgi:hypothetical protein
MNKICILFLKLKHWQLFLIWIVGSIQMQVFMNTDFWVISFYLYYSIIFGWIYSIGKVLNSENESRTKNLNFWSLLHFFSIISIMLNFRNFYVHSSHTLNVFVDIIFGLLMILSIFKVANISAKSLKMEIIKREVTFKDYVLYFFLILYIIIGVWVLQPKLNKIIDKK